MPPLPPPEIVRCLFDENVSPQVPAMILRWDADNPSLCESVWHLPENVVIRGAAPHRFGVTINRLDDNQFQVHVIWNGMSLNWERLTHQQIVGCSLMPILDALGTDLWYLLDQPIAERLAA